MEEVPTGFRFYPREEELVRFYLWNKLEGRRSDINRVIPDINIYDKEPWELPGHSGQLCRGDPEQWFFFTPRQEREARGGRPSRTTASGYWKATGSPGYVFSSDNKIIGVKKTMVFYEGKAPTGRKTRWKMNEYRAIEEVPNQSSNIAPKLRHEFSLCRVYVISGSFRAFDRRPPETTTRIQGEWTAPSPHNTRMVRGSSSAENSGSGGDDHINLPQAAENANSETNDGLQQPLWEWEQLNWL